MGNIVPNYNENNRINRRVYVPSSCSCSLKIENKSFPVELQDKISQEKWQEFINDFESIQANSSMCFRIWLGIFSMGVSEICTCSSIRVNKKIKECLDKWNQEFEPQGIAIMRRRQVGGGTYEINWLEIAFIDADSIKLRLQRELVDFECIGCCRYRVYH